jgi:hypothetical protein
MHSMDLSDLMEMTDWLVEQDPSTYSDAQSIEDLQRILTRIDAFTTMAIAQFDASGEWADDGARNTAAWMATRCHLPKPHARGVVRRGRALRHLPCAAEAWAAGDITRAQVDALAALHRETTEVALERDESILVEQARLLPYDSFTQVAHYWDQLADPDGVERNEEKRHARREVYLDSSFGGMWLGKITLDPISGTIVAEELERLEQELFKIEWSEARAALGREPTVNDLSHTAGQRRADALVEMAVRSKMARADGRRPAPLFSVLVGYETLHGRICELAQGSPISPGSLIPWLDQAYVERAVFTPGTRVEISPTARFFTGATRRAVEIRDRACVHPYCDRPASHCDIDHIVPCNEGGLTTQENGRVLCGFHNRLRNQRPSPDD